MRRRAASALGGSLLIVGLAGLLEPALFSGLDVPLIGFAAIGVIAAGFGILSFRRRFRRRSDF